MVSHSCAVDEWAALTLCCGCGACHDRIGSNANGYVASSNLAVQGDVSVQCGSAITSTLSVCTGLQQNTPVGSVVMFAGAAAPPGFLLCDGSSVSRTMYSTLFGVLQTSYGIGDGATTFTLPDLRSKTVVGVGQGQVAGTLLTSRPLGSSGGEELHNLTVAEMPTHGHTTTEAPHTHGLYDPGHSHDFNFGQRADVDTGETGNYWKSDAGGVTSVSGTGISINAATTGLKVNAAGSNVPHNNMPPFIALNYIIKY